MTTTLRPPTNARLNGHANSTTPAKVPAPPSALRRNRPRIATGLAVMALCVLGVVTAVARGSERQQVLALASDVPAGSTINSEDLVAIELPSDTNLPTIGSVDIELIVGETASVTLSKGTLLNRSMVSDEPRVPDGMALLGVVLDSGQYPIDLREGDQVELIEAASASVGAGAGVVNLGGGEVRQIAEPTTGGKALVVSLLVPKESADRVAASGAAGRISLLVVGSP